MSKYFQKLICKIRGTMDIQKLIKSGLKIGDDVFINYGCDFDESFCWLIEIGDHVIFAPKVHLLAHDASTKKEFGYTKIGKIKIGNNVFIGTNCVVLPGVHIGNRVIIGAGSIVSKDILDDSVAVGVPAKIVSSYNDYMNKQKEIMKNSVIYDVSYTLSGKVTEEKKRQMNSDLESHRIGFIV